MTYRPPGRSNRAGRAQADNDVFEGLPVKQWGYSLTHVSLAPPKSETANAENDKWGDPPMPRDYQLLQPWTQQLLRLARSGKIGNKRKSADPDAMDDDKHDDHEGGVGGGLASGASGEDSKSNLLEDRGYAAKKWKPVPEALLEPEHKHFEFLAKRRKGLPSLYAPEVQNGPVVPMRRTKVQKTGADGEVTIYEVLVPEGQTVEGEVAETAEIADVKPVVAVPGTVIEGVGIANKEGVVVAEHLKPPAAPRRNRPPPKKKGGPGRGKKRVTFTNPDGSTYTTIVPNATKIVPEPGQTVTHVAKGEEAKADITAEQAAANAAAQTQGTEGEGEGEGDEGDEGEGSDEEGDEGDDDDDREEGEVSEDAPSAGQTPVSTSKTTEASSSATTSHPLAVSQTQEEDVAMPDADADDHASASPLSSVPGEKTKPRDSSSSPDLPLAKTSHSRSGSLVTPQILEPEAGTAADLPPPSPLPLEIPAVDAVGVKESEDPVQPSIEEPVKSEVEVEDIEPKAEVDVSAAVDAPEDKVADEAAAKAEVEAEIPTKPTSEMQVEPTPAEPGDSAEETKDEDPV